MNGADSSQAGDVVAEVLEHIEEWCSECWECGFVRWPWGRMIEAVDLNAEREPFITASFLWLVFQELEVLRLAERPPGPQPDRSICRDIGESYGLSLEARLELLCEVQEAMEKFDKIATRRLGEVRISGDEGELLREHIESRIDGLANELAGWNVEAQTGRPSSGARHHTAAKLGALVDVITDELHGGDAVRCNVVDCIGAAWRALDGKRFDARTVRRHLKKGRPMIQPGGPAGAATLREVIYAVHGDGECDNVDWLRGTMIQGIRGGMAGQSFHPPDALRYPQRKTDADPRT